MTGQSPPPKHRYPYHWIEDTEYLEKYRPGGYHPVMIGDVLGKRYRVVDKLGYGGYSTVWLARDIDQGVYVALKVGISDSRLHETAVLKDLADPKRPIPSSLVASSGHDAIPPVLDEFTVSGPNGIHPCYATAPAQCSLGEASRHYLFQQDVARALSVKLVLAIAYMHTQGYLHGDIHLDNIMVRLPSSLNDLSVDQLHEKYGQPDALLITRIDGDPLPPNLPSEAVRPLFLGKNSLGMSLADTQLVLADFGEAFAPESDLRFCQDSRSPLFARPPEARFEPQSLLTFSADVWSLALAIWHLAGMRPPFSDQFVSPDAVVAQQVDVLGSLPLDWWHRWEQRHQFFDAQGNSTQGADAEPPLGEAFDECVQKYRKKQKLPLFCEAEKSAFLKLIRQMLSFKPQKRPTAADVLESEWIVKWAMPDFERSMQQVEFQGQRRGTN